MVNAEALPNLHPVTTTIIPGANLPQRGRARCAELDAHRRVSEQSFAVGFDQASDSGQNFGTSLVVVAVK